MKKKNAKTKHSHWDTAFQYLLLILGAFVLALAFNMLLSPNKIASGGVTGLSLLIKQITGVEPAFVQWAINIPLLILGLVVLGKRFGLRTALGSVVLPLFIYLTRDFPALTENPLLASVFGGALAGVGVGLSFKGKGSSGGFAILSNILTHHTGISLGRCSLMLDAIVVLLSGFVFNPENALYAMIAVYLTGKAIDTIQIGFHFSKVALVISERHSQIREAVLEELERGATELMGVGAFSRQEKNVLLLAVSQSEVNKLKEIIHLHDPLAFIIMWDSYEILGRGFHHAH